MTPTSKFLSDFKCFHDRHNQVLRMMMREDSQRIQQAESFLKKAVDCCDFCMCMSVDAFEKALKDNEMKEMSETGTGSTNGGINTRREVMKQLYMLDSTKYSTKDMPKFGALVSKCRRDDLIHDLDLFYHYGAIMVTFKKERVINRTTMTVGTSLNFGESLLKTPTFVTDPKFICIKGFPKAPNQSQNYFLGLKFFTEYLIDQKKLSPCLPNRMLDFSDFCPGFENFELQIFGKLTFSDDVEKIEYMPLYGGEEESLQKLQPLIEQYGLECTYVFDKEESVKPFEKTFTVKSDFGQDVQYGLFEKDSDIFFILKTGNNGSLNGYMNKYLRIATNTAEKFGVNAIIANNPENPDDNFSPLKMDIDMKFIKRLADERHINNYKVYYMGYSNSAQVGVCNAARYPEIVRLLALNTLSHNEDAMLYGINNFKGEKILLIHGTEDMFMPNIQALAMEADNKYIVKFVPVQGADHQFVGMMEYFIHVNEMMFH